MKNFMSEAGLESLAQARHPSGKGRHPLAAMAVAHIRELRAEIDDCPYHHLMPWLAPEGLRTKEAVAKASDQDLARLVGRCHVEDDPNEWCLACYAYEVSLERDKARKEEKAQHVYDSAGLFVSQNLINNAARIAWQEGTPGAELRSRQSQIDFLLDQIDSKTTHFKGEKEDRRLSTSFGPILLVPNDNVPDGEAFLVGFSGQILVRITNLGDPQ